MFFDQLSSAISLIQSGKLRALAVTAHNRSKGVPDVPTIAEAGVPGSEATITSGILAPAGTSPAIVNRLLEATAKVLRTNEMRASFAKIGVEVSESTPQQFIDFLKEDREKWLKVIRMTGVKGE